jgi:hypothetical protein
MNLNSKLFRTHSFFKDEPTRPQTPFSVSLFSILTTTAALAVFLSAATSQAATVVTDTSTADDDFANFTGVDAPSASDYADQNAGNGVTAAVSAGSPEPTFDGFPVTRLNDGISAVDGVIFRNTTNLDGRYHYDLGSAIEIAKITSYSSNVDARAGQKYSVWGSVADTIPSTTTTLDIDTRATAVGSVRSDLMDAGWTLIADVDVFQGIGSSGAMITPDNGTSLGSHRWLMFNVQRMGGLNSNLHPFMMEIDVYQVPEPSTFALGLMSLGCLGWWRRRA